MEACGSSRARSSRVTISRILPGELGFYDLRVPETRAPRRPRLRASTAFHGFCYYFYWFDGPPAARTTAREVQSSGEPDFPFCVCWANENWTRRWDGQDNDILVAQRYYTRCGFAVSLRTSRPSFAIAAMFAFAIGPLSHVYRANSLPDPRAFAERFREQARRDGVGEPFLAFIHLADCRRRTNGVRTRPSCFRRMASRSAK
jgi:lipopolysaccharide biosynthesis protein